VARVRRAVLARLAARGRSRQRMDPMLPLERAELRRRTGWLTFGLMVAGMCPMLAVVLVEGPALNPVLAQLMAWGVLWSSPVLTAAPARLVATLVAIARGWVGLDGDGPDGGGDVGGPPPDSHEFPLAG
jgi:nitrate reductase NapE component